MTHFRIARVWLGILVLVVVVARAGAQPIASTDNGACPLHSQGIGNPRSYQACAQFANVAPATIERIPHDRFGEYNNPVVLSLLSDGSPVIQGGFALFHAADGRLDPVLSPLGANCESDMWALIGAFDQEAFIKGASGGPITGVRLNGSIAFKWSQYLEKNDDSRTTFIAPDKYGTLWFGWSSNDRTALYAYDARTRMINRFNLTFVVGGFRSPNGHVYAASNRGLFELASQPRVSVRLVHAPIPAPAPAPMQLGVDWPYGPTLAIRAVGPDGSLWASTVSQVVHVHPDGTTRIIRLAPPAKSWHMPPTAIPLTMARDGSIWVPWGPIHITADDRVELVTVPENEQWRDSLSPSPDGSVWVLAYNKTTGQRDVVHFTLSASRKSAVQKSWIAAPSATPTPCR
jgi:hypothetical protein